MLWDIKTNSSIDDLFISALELHCFDILYNLSIAHCAI